MIRISFSGRLAILSECSLPLRSRENKPQRDDRQAHEKGQAGPADVFDRHGQQESDRIAWHRVIGPMVQCSGPSQGTIGQQHGGWIASHHRNASSRERRTRR